MMTTRLAVLGALCVAALSHVADVTAYRPGDKYCVVSKDNACPVDKLELSTTDQSALVYPGGKTRCAFDAYNDGNYSTNATFFFQVFPVKEKKEKTKLLLYLQGGGACVGNNTCDFALQCSKQTFQPNARALSEGVLNRTHPENIFNDWNIVHVPYCTGDIHIGNRTHGGPDIGFEAFLGHPKCLNQNQSVHHNGYENSMSAFNWALANFPEVDQLAIAGSSAGSLGAQLFGKLVADMWKVEEKKIRYSVIADSYVGVVPLDKPASTIVNYFDACTLPFDLPQKLVQMCLNNSGTIVELISPLLDETSYADWFFINSMGDEIQRMFYELVRVDVFGFIQLTENTTISEANFYANMTSILDQYKDDTKRLTTFFVEGDHHVFLNLDDYYNTPRMNSKEKLGVVLQNVLNNIYPASSGSGSKSAGTPVPGTTSGAASTVASLLAVVVAAVAVLL